MSIGDIISDAVGIAFTLATIFIIVRALSLRRALVDRPYRARALWSAIGASSLIALFATGPVDAVFGNNPTTLIPLAAEAAVYGWLFLGIFGWIIINNDVTLAADFLNRDALSWRKGGRILSSVVWVATYVIINLPPWWFPASGAVAAAMNFFANVVSSFIFFGVAGYGGAVLYISYKRVNDLRIKTYTRWVVLSIVALLVGILATFITPEVFIIFGIPFIYCMYKSVGSLAIRTHTLTV